MCTALEWVAGGRWKKGGGRRRWVVASSLLWGRDYWQVAAPTGVKLREWTANERQTSRTP